MRKEMISELCRFYQGEEKCPFEGDALKLWDIERIYFEALRDADKLSLAIASSFNHRWVVDGLRLRKKLRTDYLQSGERSHRCPVMQQDHSSSMR